MDVSRTGVVESLIIDPYDHDQGDRSECPRPNMYT